MCTNRNLSKEQWRLQEEGYMNPPAGLYGKGFFHIANGESLSVYSTHGHAPGFGAEATQLWDVLSWL